MDSISEQIIEAVGIMSLGMTLVTLFLTMLILGIKIVAWKFAPEPATPKEEPQKNENLASSLDPKILAVITAAIHQYRAKA